MSVNPVILSIHPTKGRLMNDINSCYCTNYSICTICARGYSTEGMAEEGELRTKYFDLFERDEFRMQSRMADAEMGDL